MTEPCRLSLEHIERAAEIIDPVFLNSPQFRAESLERQLDCRIVVKVEILNPIRSFKGRGAEYLAASLDGRPHLGCATAGNFGQGMAYAARRRGLPLTIFASVAANSLKVERMRALGADVRLIGEDFDAAHTAAKAFAAEIDAQLIEDGRDRAIAEGAGTIGLELLRWPERFDAILVPLGEGAPADHSNDRNMRQRCTRDGTLMAGRAGSEAGASRDDCGRNSCREPVPGGACRY